MPKKYGSDSKGSWVRWGDSGAKYYYTPGNRASKKAAEAKADKQAAAAYAHGYKGNQIRYQLIVRNFKPLVRHERMQGRDWLVVPCVIMVEGVLNGNCGPLYYSSKEMAKVPAIWNHKPVVVYHPGTATTACDKHELEVRGIGMMMNTRYAEGKLLTEAWLDPTRIALVDERIEQAINSQTIMELSTGLYTDVEPEEGEFNGTPYVGRAVNFRPDHLAVLPDVQGACSVEDGAGFLRLNEACENELSYDDKRSQLRGLLVASVGEDDVYVTDVFDDRAVYDRDGKLYQQKYGETDDKITLVGLPTEVIRKVTYEPVTNSVKGADMKKGKKEELVKALVDNERTRWTNDDVEFLSNLEEVQLEKMAPVEPEGGDKTDVQRAAEAGAAGIAPPEPAGEPVAAAPAPPAASAADEPATAQNVREMTPEEYIAKAPKAVGNVLRHGLATYNAEVKKLVEQIVAHPRNTFRKEYLETKDVGELRSIVNVMSEGEEEDPRFDYSGQGPVDNVYAANEEPLPLPESTCGADRK